VRDLACYSEDQTEGKLRDGTIRGVWNVEHGDARATRPLEIDVVYAHPGPSNDPETPRHLNDLASYCNSTTDNEDVSMSDQADELIFGRGELDAHVIGRGERRDRVLVDRINYEDA
jgi:hypothetical protein